MRLSLQQKEQFFHELSELIRSGRSLPQALEIVGGSRSSAMREVAGAMLGARGDGSAEGFFSGVSAFSDLDRGVVAGGDQSGRLDDALLYLSRYYEALSSARRRILAGSAYPFFLLHFAAVMLAIPTLVAGDAGAFLRAVLGFLAIFYVAFGLLFGAGRALTRAAESQVAADRFLQRLPGLGPTRVALVGSRFCMLMALLVKASGGILGAVARAGAASGSALFARGSTETVEAVRGGASLGGAAAGTRAFPEAIERAFQVGEVSGRIDEEFERQAERFTEQFHRRLALTTGALTKVVFLVVAGVIAWRIISFYLGYFTMLNGLLE